MRQYLVRHGQSVSNVELRVQGQEDVDLSELGCAEALEVAIWASQQNAKTPIDEIWSSPLKRARHTAEAISAALGLPLLLDEGLRELHAGVFQGHLWADLEQRFPDELARWRSGDADYTIPGGESRAALARRGSETLCRLAARNVETIIVVAHGGVLTAALGELLGPRHPLLAAAALRPFTHLPALANASVTVLEWPGPELIAFNTTDHLSGG
jgi:probable phosphoglycerate mutase